MTSFRDQAYGSRVLVMGDIAEQAFIEAYPNHHRSGINRPPMNVAKMSLKARYTPDYMVQDGMVEVMGVGRDQTLKTKVEKLIALMMWLATDPVDLFIWDSSKKRHCRGPLDTWIDAMFQHGTYELFPEGKPYVGLHARHFPFEWAATLPSTLD